MVHRNLSVEQEERRKRKERMFGRGWGKGDGLGNRCWCVCTGTCKTDSGNLLYSEGSSAWWWPVMAWRGGVGWAGVGQGGRPKREGLYVFIWLIHFFVQLQLTPFAKQLYPTLKNSSHKILTFIQGSLSLSRAVGSEWFRKRKSTTIWIFRG